MPYKSLPRVSGAGRATRRLLQGLSKHPQTAGARVRGGGGGSSLTQLWCAGRAMCSHSTTCHLHTGSWRHQGEGPIRPSQTPLTPPTLPTKDTSCLQDILLLSRCVEGYMARLACQDLLTPGHTERPNSAGLSWGQSKTGTWVSDTSRQIILSPLS